LSPDWQLLGSIGNPVQRRDYQSALQLLNKKGGASFEESVPTQASSDIKAGLPDALADFRASVTPGGNVRLLNTMSDGMKLLSSYYSAQGMSGQAALNRATQALLGGYQFLPNANDGSVTMRIPRGLSGVQTYAAQQQAMLKATDLAPEPVPAGSKLTPAQAQEQAREAAQSGVWATSPDDQGLTLLRRMPDGLGWTPVLRANGQRVTFRFADVPRAVAAAQAATPSPLLQPMTAP